MFAKIFFGKAIYVTGVNHVRLFRIRKILPAKHRNVTDWFV